MRTLQPNQTAALHDLIRINVDLAQVATHHKALTAARNQAIIDALETQLTLRQVASHAGVSYQYIDRLRNSTSHTADTNHLTPIRQPQATTPTTNPTKPRPDNNDAWAA